jgi:flagellar basal body-associated protein FliL
MTPEFQLIQQIRELVQSDMIERNPVLEDFAEQFSEICHEANMRLQRCAEYLAKGMRSEAVHEATSAPNLLQLAEAIDFPEQKKWRNVCLDLELATFPTLPEDILARLKAECSREEELAPLLGQYRRAVYQADRNECIRLLRELRERDPDNPSWPQNLQPLEENQLPEIIEQAHEALANDDLYSLKAAYAELTHPQRVVAPSPSLLGEIKHALLGERREETMRQGKTLVARLEKALGAGDEESITSLMHAWDKLAVDEAFEPTPDMQALVGRVRDWQELREREAEAEAEHQGRLEAMWAVLEDAKADEAHIRHEWDKLQVGDREIPDRLVKGVDEALARRQAARRHRRRLVATVVMVLVLAAIGAVGIVAWLSSQRSLQTRILAKLAAMEKDRQYEELDSYLDSLRQNRPKIYQLPEVSQYVDKVATVLKQQDETDRTFDALMEQLDKVRKEGFLLSGEQIQRIVDETRSVARTKQAQTKLTDWESSWSAWKSRRQRETDDSLVRVTLQMREILDSRKSHPFTNLDREGAALRKVPPLIQEGAPFLANASTAHVETFKDLSAQYDAWQRDYERRVKESEEANEELAGLRKGIPASLPDLNRYFSLLEQFVNRFPDQPAAASYKQILARKQAYTQAVLLEDFRLAQFPPDQQAIAQIAKWLQGPLQGSVWEGDLKGCLDYVRGNMQVRRSLPLLLSETKTLGLKVFYIRPKGEIDWRPVYYPDTIGTQVKTDDAGNQYRIYFGKIYWYEGRDQKPFLTHTKDVFPNFLNTRDYDIRIQHQDQENLVPQGKFLYSFVARATGARQMDVYLLQGIKSVLANEEIQPVPRAWVLKRLVAFTVKSFPSVPEGDAMLDLTRKLPTDVPWGNPQHLDVIRADQEIHEALKKFPKLDPIIAQLQAQRELTTLALSRRVHCVGSMQRDKSGSIVPRFVRQPPSEVWILTVTATGTRPYFRVAGYVQQDGSLKPEKGVEGDLVPGQLLLAPADDRDTRELRQKLNLPGLVAPDSWPTNVWK